MAGGAIALVSIALKDAPFPDAFTEPLGRLFQFGVAAGAYWLAKKYASWYREPFGTYRSVTYAVVVVTLFAWARFGTHVEDADPIRGTGQTYYDFSPTASERSSHAAFLLITLLPPALLGAYHGRNGP